MTILNIYGVGVIGDKIVILRPQKLLTKCEAVKLAAWLIAMATTDYEAEFIPLLKDVMNS